MADNDSLSEFLKVAVDAAKSAGEIIRKGFHEKKNVEHKGQVDLVTETDKACEVLIFNHLKKHYPEHKFIGEETSAACGTTDQLTDNPTWIVDPLDGTTNFVHGFPFVCVSIGLTIGKFPTVGVVYNPILNEELLTRHKSTVAEFLSKNYDWFFAEFNSKLLSSPNYITRRQAIKLLGEMLLDRSNSVVMTRYVSSKDNLMILMNLLRESSKNIQIEAFHVFKLFAANQNKPPEIVTILVANKNKLLRLFGDFKLDREDEQFESDKAQVVNVIATLSLE